MLNHSNSYIQHSLPEVEQKQARAAGYIPAEYHHCCDAAMIRTVAWNTSAALEEFYHRGADHLSLTVSASCMH